MQQKTLFPTEADDLVTFGRHRGERWADVPSSYLHWCVRNFESGCYLQFRCAAELSRRLGVEISEILSDPRRNRGKSNRRASKRSRGKNRSRKGGRDRAEPSTESSETHYQWTGPTGRVEWIPHDVDMTDTVDEPCPF